MQETAQNRRFLVILREEAGLSQGQLAERVGFTTSRISRLESGDTELSTTDALILARAIKSEKASAFVRYLEAEWRILQKPAFDHVSRECLWRAEEGLQQLVQLESDPELKNAFVQQIRSCKAALERAAEDLRSTDHPVALIGAPGVGKTTTICNLAGLRYGDSKPDLDRQMALQTGGGRTTVCEVHIQNGKEYSISVEPCSVEEVQQYVSEFCDDRIKELDPNDKSRAEGGTISAEVERAIRNMSGLTIKRSKGTDGKQQKEDLALELAKAFPKNEDLFVQVLTRMDLGKRSRASISLSRETVVPGLEWISKTFAEINYGKHPEFSLPRRISISVPERVLSSEEFDLRLIDTRGVDEPSVPRRDLQMYLDDTRTAIVLCSGFGDAPEAAAVAIISRAAEAGLQEALIQRGLLAVLPREGEDLALRDSATGERVTTREEGREIKRDHITSTLLHHGFKNLRVYFADVRSQADSEELRSAVLESVRRIRRRTEQEIEFLVGTIGRLVNNRETEETRAVFIAATKNLRNWFADNEELPVEDVNVQKALIEEMDGLRYVSSLRAAVNRRGSWHNFDYWYGLGFGTRREAVSRASKRIEELKVLTQAVLRDTDLELAHDFIQHFSNEAEKAFADLFQWAQVLGEGSFHEPLGEDSKYWQKCQERWGDGPGYKSAIKTWTAEWFGKEAAQSRRVFIEIEMQRKWKDTLNKLNGLLSSTPTEVAGITTNQKEMLELL
jgi:transcriptional regulator with XRE-family HTH domain/GTPase SAR1 family protein